jgi:hypothetical protein
MQHAWREMRKTCKNVEKRRTLWKRRLKWEDNIKMDISRSNMCGCGIHSSASG